MRSLNSAFSALRCSVASATDLSNALMPASSVAISSERVAIPSSAAAIEWSSFATVRSRAFFLSSEMSSCLPQYSFLLSSSCCSLFRLATMSSIIFMTLSKPPLLRAFFPDSASARRSSCARSRRPKAPCALRMAARARERIANLLVRTCTKLALALGSVFLKSSSASSSLSSLIVSARATSSSERVFDRSSHSADFVAQPLLSSARKFLSSSRDSSVSVRSSFICTTFTPSSLMSVSFA
mmetsp:Transcript_67736/g.191972  ORF Transcript_67736/g.191972 Transcript_67736/m.191972 type:complete len:240 (-) Transcript_67736:841-1560(-)